MQNKIKKRGRPVIDENKLSKEKILFQTKLMLKEKGKIPSVRSVARELNIDTMAIYHYFSNKNILLEAVTVSLLEEIYQPVSCDDWENELKKLCESYLKLLVDNNGLLGTLLSMSTTGSADVFAQKVGIALEKLNISSQRLDNIMYLLVDFLHGFAFSINCDSSNKLETKMSEPSLELIFNLLKL